ncbi:MAG: (Fe-S)-binding protein [Proteobacteria bacterium]|nr:(Fe-S)-binding protein [Pseudomonadota bacterium]
MGLADSSPVFVDIFSACLLCGACSAVCPRQINVCRELVAARATFSSLAGPHGYEKFLARKLLDYPAGLNGLRILGRAGEKLLGARLPKDSGLRLRLAQFSEDAFTSLAREKGLSAPLTGEPLTWFPGCASRYLFPDMLSSCRSLLAGSGYSLNLPGELACCGLAAWAAGDMEGARKSGRRNIQILEASEGPVLVSCASCFAHLGHYPELFADQGEWQQRAEKVASRLVELSVFLALQSDSEEKRPELSGEKLRVYYHAPCHLRHGSAASDQAHRLLQETGRAEVLELPGGQRCCGQGGLFHVAHPELSASIRDQLVTDVLALQPQVVTSTCSGCLMQWQQGLTAAGSRVKVLHLAQLLEQMTQKG